MKRTCWIILPSHAVVAMLQSIAVCSASTFDLQHGALPDATYVYEHTVIRNDTFLIDTPQGNSDLLVGTKADTGTGDQGELRSLIEFDLSPVAAGIGTSPIVSVTLNLQHLPTTGGLPRIDGTPKVDVHSYAFDVVRDASTWNDPDGDGNTATGDTTPGGTVGAFLNTFGELSQADGMLSRILESTPEFIAAVQSALAGDQMLRLILVEDDPNLDDRDIAFFFGIDTRSPATLPLLSITTEEPGGLTSDFDEDGDVDGADFLTWQRGVGSVGGPDEGDANEDGMVDGLDLDIWKSQFGSPPATAAAGAIPEPSALALAICSAWLAGVLFQRGNLRLAFEEESSTDHF